MKKPREIKGRCPENGVRGDEIASKLQTWFEADFGRVSPDSGRRVNQTFASSAYFPRSANCSSIHLSSVGYRDLATYPCWVLMNPY